MLYEVTSDLRAVGGRVVEAIAVVGSEGAEFAAKHGAVVGDELVDYVLELDDLDSAELARLASAAPARYRLVHWRDPAPDALLDSYAHAKRFVSDAPNRHPPQVPPWTAALVRQAERERAERGEALWVTAAMLDGKVVAFTEISAGTSVEGDQHDTVVLPDHRRCGLASCIKADLILRLRTSRPDLHTVGVTCAVANTGMRAVNQRVGFLESGRRNLMRLPLLGA